jgi:hypothetical protein
MKPCHVESRIVGVLHICNRPAGHDPPHVLEVFKHDTAREPVGFGQAVTVNAQAQPNPWHIEGEPEVPIPEALWKLAEKDDLVRGFCGLMRVHHRHFDQQLALEMIAKMVERNEILTKHLTDVITRTPIPPIKLP